jgi:hypothetical protein
MPAPSLIAPQAGLIFRDAFDRFKDTVTVDEARTFQSTTLQDVRDAARDLEKQLGERQSLRNMRRIQPFFAGLERYSKAVEILCNGTPYLPWIWVRQLTQPSPRELIANLQGKLNRLLSH